MADSANYTIFTRMKILHTLLPLLICNLCFSVLHGQPYTSIDLDKDKPKKYEDRKLGAERTGEKKFNFSRKVYQNMVTHYNYYFNANQKINDLIVRAKSYNKDDYTHLLSFYNYSLDNTSREKQELDSIIYKCNAGILLHDLRNSWIDNLYMLMGKAYLLRKDYDSATAVFQYINYIYAPKDDGYDIPIGSNSSNTNGVFTIATNENKRKALQKLTSVPPSRNESFIWQARTYIEQGKLSEATGLLSILRSDPNFPKRLLTDLHEMIAYNFYKQEFYDSAAWHLQKALDNAEGKDEQARWEYLCGQLYQLAHNNTAAIQLFEKAIQHATDPYMDVYARLNIVGLASSSQKENVIQNNINELYKLAKRDRYQDYRDIIYYAAASLQLEQKNKPAAIGDLLKSIQFNIDNLAQKQKSTLLLADVYYRSLHFKEAYRFYDSLNTNTLSKEEVAVVHARKPALKIISEKADSIHLQDSLLQLAAMPEAERVASVKKLYRQLRKQQGLKDNGDIDFGGGSAADNTNAASSLFGNQSSSTDFYFNNASLKAQGAKDFKIKWGTRPNVDNWRRQSAINAAPTNFNINAVDIDQLPPDAKKKEDTKALTYEGMLLNIPLTQQKKEEANIIIINSLFTTAQTLQNQLEEYVQAIVFYDSLMKRYPENSRADEVLFNLIYCYKKLNLTAKSDSVKTLLTQGFPNSKWTHTVIAPPAFGKDAATQQYEHIYNLFVEGNFEEAKKAKLEADQKYGSSHWTPQLLYIEAVYYIKQREDSTAINRLQSIITKFGTTPLADKAKTMVDVLKRRKQIEEYLTNLKIEQEETAVEKRVDLDSTTLVNKPLQPLVDSTHTIIAKEIKVPGQLAQAAPIAKLPSNNTFTFNPVDQHYVMISLHKVDEVYISEARNAFNRYNRERYYNQPLQLTPIKLTDDYSLILIGPFANAGNAMDYVDRAKPLAGSRIISWLSKDKYNFSIISETNLTIMKNTKDVEAYQKFIRDVFPDKF
ncbi:MAG: hypothetical protein KGO81_10360 [Bacteroidota bacterium]|nr:hypothetical protein [Bacteroidota bacterium]